MNNERSKIRTFYFCAILTLVVPPILQLWRPDDNAGWVAAFTGGFVTLIIRFNELSELSLGPLKAKMRDTIAKATATIDQLRELAAVISQATLTDIMASNFMGGVHLRDKFAMHDDIVATLQALGLSQERINQITENWKKGIGILYFNRITASALMQIDRSIPNKYQEVNRASQALLKFDTWESPSPQTMQVLLEQHNLINDETTEWLSDYEHFLKAGEIKNFEEFIEETRSSQKRSKKTFV